MTVANLYPLDGPHTAEQVVAAARDVDGLVRYLNHATRSRVLDNPADLYAVLGGLTEAALKLPQLFDQLAAQAGRYTTTPDLFDDRGGNPVLTAADLRAHLRAAWDRALRLVDPLQATHEACSRLGVQTPKGTP